MTTPPDELALAADFRTPTRDEWRELVRAVLAKSGRSVDTDTPEDLLATTTYDGIDIAPLYTSADHMPPTGLPGLPPFTRGGQPTGTAGGWDVRARHADPDPSSVNEQVLADLENGVGSLWLAVGPTGLPVDGLPTALAGVLLDLAPVTLDAGAGYAEAAATLLALHAERGLPDTEVGGNLGIDPIGLTARTGEESDVAAAAALVAEHAGRYPALRGMVVDALPYHQAGGSDAEELGCAVATGVAYLRALTDAGLDVDVAAGQLEFRYAVNADQFLGIAKLRAARRLWARVTEVSGVRPAARAQRQHAVTAPAMMTRRDPWVNLLRTTVACFAAGIGGADAVTVAPFDAAIGRSNAFARRIARNTQSILLEESRLAGVIDPAGGSWYVESLTDALARRAWTVFTELERAGGIAAALASGELTARLAETWARRAANLATRTDAITGVSEYPNLAEPSVTRPPLPEEPTGGLPRLRYAQEFEALRDRSDSGPRPVVFLATLGPVAAHAARAGFAANLLQAGGIETPTAGTTSDSDAVLNAFVDSGATVACLCGTDKAYAAQAAGLASRLKHAGARSVLLAGSPNDAYPDVDTFLYRGCDALAVLHTTLEVAR
ncbi:MAG TPA: methylmalonyl-CoA mutase subunit beta [Pseudonocardiaceae bacterium]|nr:methylmalonyl-CoA mutase subunit beta [Pseudonocardiaceae bacterium]